MPIYQHLVPYGFDIYRVFALTYRHQYLLSMLQGTGNVVPTILYQNTNTGPLLLLDKPIDKQSHLIYNMMVDLYRPGCVELYSSFACKMFQQA